MINIVKYLSYRNFNYLYDVIKNIISSNDLYYIVENAGWSIKHDGQMVTSNLKGISSKISITSLGIRNSIVHYGSIGVFLSNNKIKLPHNSNKVVVTWFHIVENHQSLNLLSTTINCVDLWHTSCDDTKNKMVDLGIPKEKIIVIPLGVDLNYFNCNGKIGVRKKLKIPSDSIVVGSFQKDGNGWENGEKPKLIKGPDIFCDVITKLSKKYNIFVLLTGPARGYVKKRLKENNIAYRHDLLEKPNEVAQYFKAIDLYIVTSRAEGGPKALLESMASGVPLVSTRVGMACDLIRDGDNGFLNDIEDVDGLYNHACKVIESQDLRQQFIQKGLNEIKSYDWKNISDMYYSKLYNFT